MEGPPQPSPALPPPRPHPSPNPHSNPSNLRQRPQWPEADPQTSAFLNEASTSRGGRRGAGPSPPGPFTTNNAPAPATPSSTSRPQQLPSDDNLLVQEIVQYLQFRNQRDQKRAISIYSVVKVKSLSCFFTGQIKADIVRVKEISRQTDAFQVEGNLIALVSQAPLQQANGRVPTTLLGPHGCNLCGIQFRNQRELDTHSSSHRHRLMLTSLLPREEAFTANKGGVIVVVLSPGSCDIGEQYIRPLSINNQNSYPVKLSSFSLIKKKLNMVVMDQEGCPAPGRPITLAPGQFTDLTITVTSSSYGISKDHLMLDFGTFQIARSIEVRCQAPLPPGVTQEQLAPKSPFTPVKRENPRPRKEDFIPGEKPPRQKLDWMNHPGNEKPPSWMVTEIFEQKSSVRVAAEVEALVKKLALPGGGALVDRCKLMKLLLYLEELQHEIDVQQYNLEGVRLRSPHKGREFFYLKVPGLAENRPSVMRGDTIHVVASWMPGKVWEGCVHRLEREDLLLKFRSDFHHDWRDGPVDVSFCIRRSSFIFMQNALSRAGAGQQLHPAVLMGGHNWQQAPHITAEPHYTEPLNNEQKKAIKSILLAEHAPLPFLIYGPPGTGKTKTLTEAAHQIFKLDPNSRILLVAPSNSAADLLAIRMLEKGCPPSTLFRINAFSRPLDDIPGVLSGVSNESSDASGYAMPDLRTIKSKRIVAVTCLMAAKLYAHGCTNFFTHVLIDEAGHAEEPLTLCITGLLSDSSQRCRLVMAGDPKQLGPVILSPLAQKHGLAVSTFERLIESTPPYARVRDAQGHAIGPLDERYICKLLVNYRSHPSILKVPNAAFYDNELICGASVQERESLLCFKGISRHLRKSHGKGSLPIIFHSVVGRDEREERSPSWFNIDEAKIVNQYCSFLIDEKYPGYRPGPIDIGIISPYRKQVEKIRTLVRPRFSNEVKVGSVEEFQGQERMAIIVSTVRSSHEHLGHDEKFRLGFLRNPKRFNVAITRAKGMLIVVGNPEVLRHDPNWLRFMRFVYKEGGWEVRRQRRW